MRRILFSSLVYLIFFVFDGDGKSPNKISGGSSVSIRQYPFQVSIQYRKGHLCGGAIVTRRDILTTASCITLEKNIFYANLEVYSGSEYHGNITGLGQLHKVRHVIHHPDYNPRDFWEHDLAILRLTNELVFSSFREMILLANENVKYKRRNQLLIGWERFGHSGSTNELRLSRLHFKSFKESKCTKYFIEKMGKMHWGQDCVEATSPGKKMTEGDSGCSVIVNVDNVLQLIGLISLVSFDLDVAGKPGLAVTTSIPEYLDFIVAVHNKL